ncbi:MAG: efflux RND transporter periplasmic adaptor subunit [Gammaproteobacteria bacterium]|nr:efflux RND transporter periplasmic adaptor subunit [Gammaproteobacteria bacterium]NNF49564.1 efflux RND transporter periplasmic adaptor subunit [Woeseiaceae bacterium]MBT8093858.1 efflux RND transporter periplasmic adaptor subunit [Gammaproteobacteria bacterium]MBT8105951.1 efflux RND transporter periplasmic adaptor subunit [Gammaproteobacteria bacterium]NNK25965.1 efflux RND transporter periplasmic adaptor subunit [Woeseiaceae bacterium]
MNTKILIGAAAVAALAAGVLIGRNMAPTVTPQQAEPAAREVLYWVAPMDPDYRRDEPGKSPMGMDLVPVYADEVAARRGVVSIDPTLVNNLGVRTAVAERGALPRRIETVGYVGYDEDTLQHVHTRVEGWVEKLATTATGDPVRKGELLFELYSPVLVNAQQEFLAALAGSNEGLQGASRDRLRALGVPEREIRRLERERTARRRVQIFAESNGVVSQLGIREGMFVTPSTEVMSIAQIDKVWIVAEVFERQSAWVEAGHKATVELDYLPGTTLQGRVDYVNPELDPTTRTLKVRLRFDNEGARLLPNMFARVVIDGSPINDIVHVPREAVIRGGSSKRVVIDLGDGMYESRKVLVGIESGERVAIRRGLREGERVVVSAQFLIDSESNIESALRRMGDTP